MGEIELVERVKEEVKQYINRNGNGVWKLLTIIAPVATTVNLLLAGWLVGQIIEIRENRFTSQDGLEVWQKIADIQESLALKAPSDEVVRWLQRHDKEIDDLEKEH
jgi:hypothetical protein